MVTKLSHTSLFVLDQDKAYDFYVNKLLPNMASIIAYLNFLLNFFDGYDSKTKSLIFNNRLSYMSSIIDEINEDDKIIQRLRLKTLAGAVTSRQQHGAGDEQEIPADTEQNQGAAVMHKAMALQPQ